MKMTQAEWNALIEKYGPPTAVQIGDKTEKDLENDPTGALLRPTQHPAYRYTFKNGTTVALKNTDDPDVSEVVEPLKAGSSAYPGGGTSNGDGSTHVPAPKDQEFLVEKDADGKWSTIPNPNYQKPAAPAATDVEKNELAKHNKAEREKNDAAGKGYLTDGEIEELTAARTKRAQSDEQYEQAKKDRADQNRRLDKDLEIADRNATVNETQAANAGQREERLTKASELQAAAQKQDSELAALKLQLDEKYRNGTLSLEQAKFEYQKAYDAVQTSYANAKLAYEQERDTANRGETAAERASREAAAVRSDETTRRGQDQSTETTRRGQNMDAADSAANRGVTTRGQDMDRESTTFRGGVDQRNTDTQAVSAERGRKADTAKSVLSDARQAGKDAQDAALAMMRFMVPKGASGDVAAITKGLATGKAAEFADHSESFDPGFDPTTIAQEVAAKVLADVSPAAREWLKSMGGDQTLPDRVSMQGKGPKRVGTGDKDPGRFQQPRGQGGKGGKGTPGESHPGDPAPDQRPGQAGNPPATGTAVKPSDAEWNAAGGKPIPPKPLATNAADQQVAQQAVANSPTRMGIPSEGPATEPEAWQMNGEWVAKLPDGRIGKGASRDEALAAAQQSQGGDNGQNTQPEPKPEVWKMDDTTYVAKFPDGRIGKGATPEEAETNARNGEKPGGSTHDDLAKSIAEDAAGVGGETGSSNDLGDPWQDDGADPTSDTPSFQVPSIQTGAI